MIYMTNGYISSEEAAGRPVTRARILWDNVLADAAFSSPSAREGFDAVNARATDTASWWWPEAGATLTMTLAAAAYIDCVAIASHTIGSAGATATVQALVAGAWQTVHPAIAPADDDVVMVLFPGVTATAVRITLSASARIGVVYAGPAMAMPQMVYASAPALALTFDTDYATNKSQTGQYLGRSVMASTRVFSATWTHLAEPWVRSDLLPFIKAARRDPFFVALRPWGYPEDVGYVWTSGDIVPQRMGVKNYMQAQVSGQAHVPPGV